MGTAATENLLTLCSICSGGCGINLKSINGSIVSIIGDEGHPVSKGHLCPKGRAVMEIARAPDRLRQPLRKTSKGGWQEISWDDALSLVFEQLRRIKATHGAQALAVHVGQAGVGQEFPAYIERFCHIFGTPNFSTSGSHCFVSKEMANVLTMGALPVPDYEKSRCILLWGKNPSKSSPSLMRYIDEAVSSGARLVVIDPRANALAGKADLHLQIRPGTDGALALGLLHVIIRECLYNKDFVERWTVGFDELAGYVRPFSPESVEKITWVPADKIAGCARLYAHASPATIAPGVALELHTNGFQTLRAIAILQAITGNLDVSGGARFVLEPRLSSVKLKDQQIVTSQAIGQKEYPLFHDLTGHAQSNLYARAIVEEKPYPIKGLVVVGSNPLLTWPNTGEVRKALTKLEFVAVMDPFFTETARMAHLVLPAATFLSRHDLWDTAHQPGDPRLILAPKVLEKAGPPTDWRFWKALATGMGYAIHFPWENEEEAIDFRLKPMGLSFEELRQKPDGFVYDRYKERKYEVDGFHTPSGKVEIYSETLKRHGYDPLPVYTEPGESPLSMPEMANEYPLILTTGARTLGYLHSRYRNLPSLRKRSPEPYVEIHWQKARELGLSADEKVIVESPRGAIELKAKLSDALHPQVISIPHGWREANANVLTDSVTLDPITGFPACRSCLARIRRSCGNR